MVKVIRKISSLVSSGNEESAEYIPADGENFRVYLFKGSSPSSTPNANVRLVWDYDGASQILWSINDEEPMPDWVFFDLVGDGIKKLAVVLDNGSLSSMYMSGSFKGEIIV